MAIDSDKLNEFLGKFVGDLGATTAAGSVVIGHNLGLYKALAADGRALTRLGQDERARTQLDRAAGLAGRYGMPHVLRDAREALGQLG